MECKLLVFHSLKTTIFCGLLLFAAPLFSQDYHVMKIWDVAPHNAFTDLIQYEGKYYCTFREGSGHNPTSEKAENGEIRILVSTDGVEWKSHALLKKEGIDLRDSKLSVTPDGRLMVLMGGSVYRNGTLISRLPHVTFMNPQNEFVDLTPVNIDPEIQSYVDWLWRVTWDKKSGIGYGVVYQAFPGQEYPVYLVQTTDGVNYRNVTRLNVTGLPNEATVELPGDGKMRIIMRREGDDRNGWLGYSDAPYHTWQWHDLGRRLGGPNLTTLPDGTTLIGSRGHRTKENRPAFTGLFGIDEDHKAVLFMEFPSDGDNGYPGFLVQGDELWVSYYSSHEGKTSIYLARIKIGIFP